MDHTVHLVDLLRWYFAAEVLEVYAEVGFDADDPEIDIAGVMLLTLSNGVQASIDCSWSRPATYPRWGHLKMDVVGEKGTAVMDCFAEYLTLYRKDAPRNPSWLAFGADPDQAMLEEFVASTRDRREPCVTWNDGYQALRVALAAYESARTHQPVRLAHA